MPFRHSANKLWTMQKHKPTIHCTPWVYLLLATAIIVAPIDWLLACACAMLVHECGHLLVVALYHGQISSIEINLFGIRIEATSLSHVGNLISSIAGPAVSFMLMLFYDRLPLLAACGTIHGILNLLPLRNMDGGQILRNVLRFFCTEKQTENISLSMDFGVRICALLAGVWVAWRIRGTIGMIFLMIAFTYCIRKIPCKETCLPIQ